MCICIYLCPWELLREQSFFIFWNAIFLFFVYFQVQKIISKKSQMPFQIIPIQNQDLYSLPLVVYLQGEIISCIILLSSLNNSLAVIIISLLLFFYKKFNGNVKVQIFDISYMYKYIYTNTSTFFMWAILLYTTCGIMYKIQ